MELLRVDSLKETIEKLKKEFLASNNKIKIEKVKIIDALDRVLAEDILSNCDVPDFNRSTVDGYAVIHTDTNGTTDTIPTYLNVVGESFMGEVCSIELKNGECIYVPTGGMMPKNADAMVMVEHTEKYSDGKIAVYDSVGMYQDVVRVGDDVKKNQLLFKKGHKLNAADLGVLSSIGLMTVEVYKKINITIISTGDELVSCESKLVYGKIRDVNSCVLYGECIKAGFDVINIVLVKDDDVVLKNAILNAMNNSDVIIVSGGSSKGKKDMTSEIINNITSSGVLTHGISCKPGKPTITSYDKNTNTFIFGLPGHPIATVMLFKMLVLKMYEELVGCNTNNFSFKGIITENIASSHGKTTFQLVESNDKYHVTPIYGHSGLINKMSNAIGYIIIDENVEGVNKNEEVEVFYL